MRHLSRPIELLICLSTLWAHSDLNCFEAPLRVRSYGSIVSSGLSNPCLADNILKDRPHPSATMTDFRYNVETYMLRARSRWPPLLLLQEIKAWQLAEPNIST